MSMLETTSSGVNGAYLNPAPPHQNPLLEAALAYARMGYHIIPLKPDCIPGTCDPKTCKEPKAPALGVSWSKGASKDPAQIIAWWTASPRSNVGIVSKTFGIAALDLDKHDDRKNGVENYDRLFKDDVPMTPVQKTANDGLHIVYSNPDLVDLPGQILDETGEPCGIDISKTYLVAEPSTAHGKPYKWFEGRDIRTVALAPLPQFIVNALRQQSSETSPRVAQQSSLEDSAVQALREKQNELSETERAQVLEALGHISPDVDHDEWVRIGMALKASGFDCRVWEEWSTRSTQGKYKPGECEKKWRSFKRGGISIGTLFHVAKQNGFKFKPDSFMLNDAGNGKRFSLEYGHLLRWHSKRKQWLVWDGKRWRNDDTLEVQKFAQDFANQMYLNALSQTERGFFHKLGNQDKRNAMLESAKPHLAITADDLDCDQFLLNCNNGTVDLRTGRLRPHEQADNITKLVPVDYDPQAMAPRFRQFLLEIFANSEELVSYVQRVFGYMCTGSVKEQKMFFAHGSGANGKSVLVAVLQKILGDYALEGGKDLLTVKYNDNSNAGAPTPQIVRLRGARFVSTQELPEGAWLNESLVKSLTGGDRITARGLHQEPEEFDPTFKFLMVTNHLPLIRSQGSAIWRRIARIPFSVTIPERDRDQDLESKLLSESQGVLNWLIQGCLQWQATGLNEPDLVSQATTEYKALEDPLAAFLAEKCVIEASATVAAGDLQLAYRTWCEQNGEPRSNKNSFPARMEERGFQRRNIKTGTVYAGLRLKEQASPFTSLRDLI